MSSQKQSVLIVDDIPDNIEVLDGILKSEYQVKVSTSGRMALKVISQTLPDLILLDVMMPDMNGYEVLEKIREDDKYKDIPIIFVTAKGEVEDETKGLALGAVDYIVKPIDPQIVKARVKTHLEIKYMRQELKEQNELLEATMQLREDMVNMVVHDMRNPLHRIKGFSELLMIMDVIPPEHLSYLEKVVTAAQELEDFVNNMLTLAKTKNKQLQLNCAPTNVSKLFDTVEQMHSQSLTSKQISLVKKVPPENSLILLDKTLLERVIDNLLSNAIKFSPTNSTITLNLEYPQSASSSFDSVRVQVIDEGMGIPKEQREYIFEKYITVGQSGKNIPQIGLGLAFCRMVLKAHGGSISVTKNEPQGSIFTIEI